MRSWKSTKSVSHNKGSLSPNQGVGFYYRFSNLNFASSELAVQKSALASSQLASRFFLDTIYQNRGQCTKCVTTKLPNSHKIGEPLWLSGKVVKNEKINEIQRPRVRSPPRATYFLNNYKIFSIPRSSK
jgi:hypothetical protein